MLDTISYQSNSGIFTKTVTHIETVFDIPNEIAALQLQLSDLQAGLASAVTDQEKAETQAAIENYSEQLIILQST